MPQYDHHAGSRNASHHLVIIAVYISVVRTYARLVRWQRWCEFSSWS